MVLADTEEVWDQVFQEQVGKPYRHPTLVMFRGQVKSACGFQSAATGPFYCPLDSKVYIDLAFFDEMKEKLGAPGDFAQAYVVAHEVGHHVQKLLGVSDQVNQLQARASKEEANELSVRLELQADFYAGVWANRVQQNWQILEEGDIEEALRGRNCDWRRPTAIAITGYGDARVVHSRLFSTASQLVHQGIEVRRYVARRYLRDSLQRPVSEIKVRWACEARRTR